jgi:hypothetical protein
MRVGTRSRATKVLAIASFAAAMLVAAPSAGAVVTIGQTANPAINCANFDRLQPTVTSGTPYVVPATVASGTITSWSTQAGNNAGPLGMKVYRPVGGNTFQVLGQDGPRTLIANALNTFSTNIAVRAGDVLGNFTPAGPDTGPVCTFNVLGEFYLRRAGNLANGSQGTFDLFAGDRRLNVSAVINPTNTFTVGAITRNKQKGIAFMPVTVPNPGTLALAGGGAVARTASGPAAVKAVANPGTVQLTIKTKKKKKLAKLNSTGKASVTPTITYTPTEGAASSQKVTVQLRKRLKAG